MTFSAPEFQFVVVKQGITEAAEMIVKSITFLERSFFMLKNDAMKHIGERSNTTGKSNIAPWFKS
ncbi:hypothetical protein NG99_18400 [Erwinia typographi]|uniref:Uncharacterized protein n=1 Tax=Erwinia typographi TaxID=371042 RepID=A0A0A3YU49_9GAMM|nr:hypothetical protein NG99_18400 [Erwinia typographi]